ncbi:MAG: hypothetical protein K5768_03470 [Firmicutes bacterium]|nr:hypothetical protein [Bacillota bacterium]
MGGSKKTERVVYTQDENGQRVPLRDANGKIVKVGVRQYTKKEKKILRQAQGKTPTKLPKRQEATPEPRIRTLVGHRPTSDFNRQVERMRSDRYAGIIEQTRETQSAFADRLRNAKPITERPKNMKMQEWLTQNPDLDKGLRLIKRELNVLRKRTGRRAEESIIHMPKPVNYDRKTQRITYKTENREAVEQAIQTIEKELKLDLGFALDRMDWVD